MSCIFNKLSSVLHALFPKTKYEQKNNESTSSLRKIEIVAAIAIGLLASCYSIELTTRSSRCDDLLDKGIQAIKECSVSRKLWNSNKKNGNFAIKCDQGTHQASVIPEVREILVSTLTMQEAEMVDSLLFELLNLNKADEISITRQRICSMPMDDYAREMEKFEYQTTIDAYNIQNECVQNGIWPESFVQNAELFEEPWSSLDKYLQHQENEVHTDLYRLEWLESCDLPEKTLQLKLSIIQKTYQKMLKDA